MKYKLLTKEELVINLDRLSRFKLPEYSYNRVFSDIILKALISPNFSKTEIENTDAKYLSKIVKEIWNKSVQKHFDCLKDNNIGLNVLQLCINQTFKNINERTKVLINTELEISQILENIKYDTSVLNLKFLIKSHQLFKNKEKITVSDLIQIREQYSLCFPVEKLLIVEGITEEILLPVFADKLNNNFNKKGIYVISAGGKSKSPSLYLKIKEKVKIPVVLLFDLDAKEICTSLSNQLLKKDKYILLSKGEFEDILSENLIKRALNAEYEPISPLSISDLKIHQSIIRDQIFHGY